MKKCLLCGHEEPGKTKPDPIRLRVVRPRGSRQAHGREASVDIICLTCIRRLIKIPHHEMIQMYIEAVKENHDRKAYFLKSLIPIAIRRKWENHRRSKKNITVS